MDSQETTDLLEKYLAESKRRRNRLNVAKSKLCSVKLSDSLSVLKMKLESLKESDQSFCCQPGIASKYKEAILAGVKESVEPPIFINDHEQNMGGNIKVDSMKKMLSVLKLDLENKNEFLAVISAILLSEYHCCINIQ